MLISLIGFFFELNNIWINSSNKSPAYNISPSLSNLNGFLSQLTGLAGTTSKCDPTNEQHLSVLPGNLINKLPIGNIQNTKYKRGKTFVRADC